MTNAKRRLIPVLAAALIAATAQPAAAGQHYQPWNNPDSPSAGAQAAAETRLQDFVDRLNALIGEAEKSRAADPQFLRDLRGLAQGFDRPWRTRLLGDDFQDGDFTRNPRWTVTAGRYWVESGWGLRSAVKAEAVGAGAPQQKRLSGKDAAVAIFGQILQQAIDPNRQAGGGTTSAGTVLNATAIQTRFRMTNAFAIEVDFSSWAAQGRLEIGPYQGAPVGAGRAQGYTLAYTPGGGLELLRVSRRGTSVIDSAPGPLNLEDKKTHQLEWTRGTDGSMTVSIDGREVLTANDRGFQGDFGGLRMVNRGGDYIFKRFAVYGTQ